MIDNVKRAIARFLVKPWVIRYLRKPRQFKFHELQLHIEPGVFHPKYFFSSLFFAEFVREQNLKSKSVCEPCCGSGIIGLTAALQGAEVICGDIDPRAVRSVQQSMLLNANVLDENNVWILQSDIFEQFPHKTYDYIFVNPPYFFKPVENEAQLAWNAGNEGEFFVRFFNGLGKIASPITKTYMVLADNCELDRIRVIANQFGFLLKEHRRKKIQWEVNYIFEIVKQTHE